MKHDKYKNKDKSKFIPESQKHGKKEIRHSHKKKSKLKAILASMDFDELENLDTSEKMG